MVKVNQVVRLRHRHRGVGLVLVVLAALLLRDHRGVALAAVLQPHGAKSSVVRGGQHLQAQLQAVRAVAVDGVRQHGALAQPEHAHHVQHHLRVRLVARRRRDAHVEPAAPRRRTSHTVNTRRLGAMDPTKLF